MNNSLFVAKYVLSTKVWHNFICLWNICCLYCCV